MRGIKIRIILTYMDSSKNKTGRDYEGNRKIQKIIEKLFEVEPDVALLCLGDFNGRLKRLEPHIDTDSNGKMIEDWSVKFNLHHLNQSEKCVGTYTFHSNKGRSAIDHMLVNDRMFEEFRDMYIDEEKELLNISYHCLVRAWFKMGPKQRTNWKNPSTK